MLKNKWIVNENESGLTLAHFLKEKLCISASKAKALIDQGSLYLNAKPQRFASTKILKNDEVLFVEKQINNSLFTTLYEDDSFLIINKPPFISSEEMASHLKPYFLCHRLDKETSGVLIFAKTSLDARFLEESFRKREVKKCYVAITQGFVKEQFFSDKAIGVKQQVTGKKLMHVDSSADKAFTEFKLIRKLKETSLIYCFPYTGRTHQIRVHLSDLKHPILGDNLYGGISGSDYIPNRLLLHAYTIEFQNSQNKRIFAKAPLYQDFREAITSLTPNGQIIPF